MSCPLLEPNTGYLRLNCTALLLKKQAVCIIGIKKLNIVTHTFSSNKIVFLTPSVINVLFHCLNLYFTCSVVQS